MPRLRLVKPLKLSIGQIAPRIMTTWLISLRGSTEVMDLDPPGDGLAATDDKPTASSEPRLKAQQPAPTKHPNPPGSTYRSFGGTAAWMQKRLKNSTLAESPRPKKAGRAVNEPEPPA